MFHQFAKLPSHIGPLFFFLCYIHLSLSVGRISNNIVFSLLELAVVNWHFITLLADEVCCAPLSKFISFGSLTMNTGYQRFLWLTNLPFPSEHGTPEITVTNQFCLNTGHRRLLWLTNSFENRPNFVFWLLFNFEFLVFDFEFWLINFEFWLINWINLILNLGFNFEFLIFYFKFWLINF